MKEWIIKDANSIFFTPKVEEWIPSTFGLNMLEATLYKVILNKHFCIWTWQYLAKVLRTSQATIGRTLKKFAEMGIIEQYKVCVGGNKTRTINIALYDRKGKIDAETIEYYRKVGYAKIMQNEHD